MTPVDEMVVLNTVETVERLQHILDVYVPPLPGPDDLRQVHKK